MPMSQVMSEGAYILFYMRYALSGAKSPQFFFSFPFSFLVCLVTLALFYMLD